MWLVGKYSGITVFKELRRAVDEVYTSRYYTGTDDLITNDPKKVAVDDKLKTRTISDDLGPYNGLRIEIQYSGGFMDSYQPWSGKGRNRGAAGCDAGDTGCPVRDTGGSGAADVLGLAEDRDGGLEGRIS
jgi:hypothetical protein